MTSMAAPSTTQTTETSQGAHTEAPSASGLAALGVNGPVLLAQMVNFFLVLVILSVLVYRPLLRLLADRRRTIEEGLAAALAQKKALAETQTAQTRLMAEAKAEAAKLVEQTRTELKLEREQAKQILATERQRLLVQTEQKLAGLEAKLVAETRAATAHLVRQATTRILEQQARTELEPAIARVLKDLQ